MRETDKIVVITDLCTPEAQSAAEYLSGLGYEIVTPPAEVHLWKEDELTAFTEPLKERLGAVIHPAPPIFKGGILEVSEEDWERTSNEGAIAAFIVTKVFCTIFREKKGGTVIYLNSIHAEKPMGKGILHSLNCGAVDMLSREAAQDYSESGVNVFFVERGITTTDDGKSDASALYFGTDMRYPRRETPKPDYLNGLLAFLLTDAAYPLSGQPIRCDAGMTGFYNQHRFKVEGREYFDFRKFREMQESSPRK
ncbi:MAG: SDR family oxidoreductase [Lachnospiraceae bacterium]|nr:SDR family oxidoreductase [Lachnospiraceae bacterium]